LKEWEKFLHLNSKYYFILGLGGFWGIGILGEPLSCLVGGATGREGWAGLSLLMMATQ